jgi:hypothetical protein
MPLKAAKAKPRNGHKPSKQKKIKTKAEQEYEARLLAIIDDPDATPMIKGLAPLLIERLNSNEPYLTIEQILDEVGRGR